MNIAYLIGNGFDLGLGLKTSYRDCVEAYLQSRKDTTDSCIKWLCKKMRDDGQETWSDAERAFGQLKFSELLTDSDHKDKTAVSNYDRCYDDFCEFFASRIMAEEKRFVIPDNQQTSVSEMFCSRIIHLDRFMELEPRNYYSNQILSSGTINLNFISFNYTKTLEKLIRVPVNVNDGFWHFKDKTSNKELKVKINKVCHVHGTFNEDNLVFGVDNPTQIADLKVREHCERIGGMLKSGTSEDLGTVNRSCAMNILSTANWIVVFGLSYGETDCTWWRKLYEKLVLSNDKQLIICPYLDYPRGTPISSKMRNDLRRAAKRNVFVSVFKDESPEMITIEKARPPKIVVLSPRFLPEDSEKCDFFGLTNLCRSFVLPTTGISET